MIRVRQATPSDVEDIYELGCRLIQKSEFSDTQISYLRCANRLLSAIQRPDEWLGIAEYKGKIVGFLLLTIVSYWWSAKDRYVLDDGIYAERPGAGTKLIQAGIRWASKQDVKELIIAITSGFNVDRTVRVLNHCGLHDRGITVSLKIGSEKMSWAA